MSPGGSLAIVAVLTFLPGVPAGADDLPPARRAEQILAEFDGTDRPGCAIGVMRDGQLIQSFARGMADIGAAKSLTPQTVFNIASVSKQFTAFGLLLLEQDGALSLDDPITKYVPELGPYARNVTLRHLLHHTGGLRDFAALLVLEGHSFSDRTTREQAVRALARQEAANSPPGTEYDYSNTGYFLAGLVIERVTGKSLRKFMHEAVFRPLGMADTQIVDRYPVDIGRLARGYARSEGEYRVDESPWEQTGDGQVHTTVQDLARWERNFLTGEVGGPALVAKLLETGTLVSGRPVPYAGGLAIGEYRGLPTIRHGGDWAGYRAHYVRFPAQRLAVAALCNLAQAAASRHAMAVAEVYLGDWMAAQEVEQEVKDLRAVGARGDAVRLPAGLYRNPETHNFLELTFDERGPRLRSGEETATLHEAEPGIYGMDEPGGSYVAFIPASAEGALPRIILQDSPRQLNYELAPEAPAGRLDGYAGSFRSSETGFHLELAMRDGRLVLDAAGAALPLRPAAPHEFEGVGLLWDGEPFTLAFPGGAREDVLLFTAGLRGLGFERTR